MSIGRQAVAKRSAAAAAARRTAASLSSPFSGPRSLPSSTDAAAAACLLLLPDGTPSPAPAARRPRSAAAAAAAAGVLRPRPPPPPPRPSPIVVAAPPRGGAVESRDGDGAAALAGCRRRGRRRGGLPSFRVDDEESSVAAAAAPPRSSPDASPTPTKRPPPPRRILPDVVAASAGSFDRVARAAAEAARDDDGGRERRRSPPPRRRRPRRPRGGGREEATFADRVALRDDLRARCADRTDPSAPERAEELLLEMADLRRRGGKKSGRSYADAADWNAVLMKWGEAGMPERAERLLGRMSELAAASARRSGGKDGADDAERGKGEKRRRGGSGSSPRPTVVNWDTVIAGYAKMAEKNGTAARRAQDVLDEMEERFEAGVGDVRPDEVSYSTCMEAWSKSREPGSHSKAESLLLRMEESAATKRASGRRTARTDGGGGGRGRGGAPDDGNEKSLGPTVYAYNCLLRACTRSPRRGGLDGEGGGPYDHDDDDGPLSTAIRTFNRMQPRSRKTPDKTEEGDGGGGGDSPREGVDSAAAASPPPPPPDHASYGYMLQTVTKHLPKDDPRRTLLASKLFERCCKDGLLGRFAFESFHDAVPRRFFERVLRQTAPDVVGGGGESFRFEDLPFEWRRNGPRSKGS